MDFWKITSTLLPLILGAVVTIGFYVIDRTRFIAKGVVGPYFASVALLFALFSSSMTTEVWQKVARANSLLTQEANSARTLLRISEPLRPGAEVVRNAVFIFLKQIQAQEIAESVSPADDAAPPTAELYRIAADANVFENHAAANTAFYNALEVVRSSWFERHQLRKSRLAREKFFILFLFGFLTQIAIALCHAGNARATAATVMLFSLSFSAASGTLAVMDDPFSTSYLINTSALADVR
jgi:hypothetical protein